MSKCKKHKIELEITYEEFGCENCGVICEHCKEKIETCLKCEKEAEVKYESKFKKDLLRLKNLLKKHKAKFDENHGEYEVRKNNKIVVVTYEIINHSPETGIRLIESLYKK